MFSLLVNARFLTQPVTGTQRYARELTTQIVRILGTSSIYLVAPEDAPPEFAGIRVIRCGGRLKGHLWEQVVLPWTVRRLGADLLWCPGNCGPLLVARQVVTIHDAGAFAVPETLNPNFVRWYRFLVPRLARRVRRVITISEFSKRELVKYLRLPPERITVIHRSVPRVITKRTSPESIGAIRLKYGLSERYVLTLASRAPHKNFGSVLRAWRLLWREASLGDVELVLAGGTTRALRADFAAMCAGELPRVRDLGYVPDEDLASLYRGAAIFVYLSLYEGFGLPPLEAMACGTPVVVSNMASLPEVVGDAGVYVNPYDVEDIARGIYRVLTDENLRRDLREKGLARARLFTWEREARETLAVFEEAVREEKSRG
jgi:glycosyltransferase involved in cell wall biosynthesis